MRPNHRPEVSTVSTVCRHWDVDASVGIEYRLIEGVDAVNGGWSTVDNSKKHQRDDYFIYLSFFSRLSRHLPKWSPSPSTASTLGLSPLTTDLQVSTTPCRQGVDRRRHLNLKGIA